MFSFNFFVFVALDVKFFLSRFLQTCSAWLTLPFAWHITQNLTYNLRPLFVYIPLSAVKLWGSVSRQLSYDPVTEGTDTGPNRGFSYVSYHCVDGMDKCWCCCGCTGLSSSPAVFCSGLVQRAMDYVTPAKVGDVLLSSPSFLTNQF